MVWLRPGNELGNKTEENQIVFLHWLSLKKRELLKYRMLIIDILMEVLAVWHRIKFDRRKCLLGGPECVKDRAPVCYPGVK